MRTCRHTSLVVLIAAAAALPAAAQDAPAETAESGVTVGLGAGAATNGFWLGGQVGFHRPSYDWLIRGGLTSDIEIFSEDDATLDFAVLRGWRFETPGGTGWRRVAVGVGVTYAEVYEEGTENCGLFGCSQVLDERTGVGLAVQGDIGFDAGGAIGLAITGQGSLNTAKSWLAVGVMVVLGPTSLQR